MIVKDVIEVLEIMQMHILFFGCLMCALYIASLNFLTRLFLCLIILDLFLGTHTKEIGNYFLPSLF